MKLVLLLAIELAIAIELVGAPCPANQQLLNLLTKNECDPNPCKAGETCIDLANGYFCWAENCHVCVCPNGSATVNLALNKQAWQSGTWYDPNHTHYTAGLAVDGRRTPTTLYSANSTCAATNTTGQPWWAVDLGCQKCVTKMIFVNRGDDAVAAARADNFIIGVTNDSPQTKTPTLGGYQKCGQYAGSVGQGATVELQCDTGTRGRYVILQSPNATHLNFCELEVYGCDA